MRECNKLLIASLFFFSSIAASHNTSRYFLFLERPESYSLEKPYSLTTDFFYISLSNAFDRLKGGSTSLTGLWGEYNLNDVIKSAQKVQKDSFNLLKLDSEAIKKIQDNEIIFEFPGIVRSQGISFRGQFEFPWASSLSLGFWIPIMHVSTRISCEQDTEKCNLPLFTTSPNPSENDFSNSFFKLDAIRRELHNTLGLLENFWSETGFGDLDLYVRWQHILHYTCMMRSIILAAQTGIVAPLGKMLNNDHPSSIPFMGNGHWSLYFDFAPEFELKQDIKVGSIFGIMIPFKHTHYTRIALGKEPHIFSALKGNVSIAPGVTFKVSPYLILENLTNGLHIQGRYTYLHHYKDRWRDKRSDQTLTTSLSNCEFLKEKEEVSSWSGHFFSFQLSYNTRAALNNFSMDPVFYINYDLPIGGHGIAKMNQVSLGIQLHF